MYSVWIFTLSGRRPVMRMASWCAALCPCVEAQTSQLSAAHVGHAVERLHGRVREIGRFVDGLDLLRGAGQRSGRVAILAAYGPGLLRERFPILANAGAVDVGMRTFVPLDGESVARLPWRSRCCRPRPRRRTKSGARASRRAWHSFSRRRNWRPCRRTQGSAHHRVQHIGHAHIDSESRLADDLIRRIQALAGRADDLELARVFQRNAGWRRYQFRCGIGQLAIRRRRALVAALNTVLFSARSRERSTPHFCAAA